MLYKLMVETPDGYKRSTRSVCFQWNLNCWEIPENRYRTI